ncbi:MAG: DUF2630 family protein [Ilumatobacteraceae bacterium]
MSDELDRISALIDEEHQLRKADVPDTARLQQIEEHLDQCWDLLRQRRARLQYGENPDDAHVRDVRTVEGYQQ